MSKHTFDAPMDHANIHGVRALCDIMRTPRRSKRVPKSCPYGGAAERSTRPSYPDVASGRDTLRPPSG